MKHMKGKTGVDDAAGAWGTFRGNERRTLGSLILGR
jgi:hypothetical protein